MNYPLLNVFLTMLWFFLWILWFVLLFRIVGDIFRSHDLRGGGKAAWLLCVLILPFVGVFVYLIARGGDMHERHAEAVRINEQILREYDTQTMGSSADEVSKYADLHQSGVLTDSEFAVQKMRILS